MLRRLVLAALAVLTLSASPVGDFRALVREATAAIQAGDIATARAKLAAAGNLVPNHPTVYALEAMAAAKAGDVDGALDGLDRYSRTGLVSRIYADPVFDEVTKSRRFASIKRRFESNSAPVGRVETLFSVPGEPFLAESVVRDAPRGRWLVSSVRQHRIIQADDAGRVAPFATLCRGVFGLSLWKDSLYADTSAAPPTSGATGQGVAVAFVPLLGGDGNDSYVVDDAGDIVIEVSSALAVAWQFAGGDHEAREAVSVKKVSFGPHRGSDQPVKARVDERLSLTQHKLHG